MEVMGTPSMTRKYAFHDKKIKFLWSDIGGEYLSHEFSEYIRACGIVSQLNPLRILQRNIVSEKRDKTFYTVLLL
jgi:hypothetical protein